MLNYFVHDEEYISGWQFFFRSLIAFLVCFFLAEFTRASFLGMGIILFAWYFQSVNAYKRGESLNRAHILPFSGRVCGIWGFFSMPLILWDVLPIITLVVNSIFFCLLWMCSVRPGYVKAIHNKQKDKLQRVRSIKKTSPKKNEKRKESRKKKGSQNITTYSFYYKNRNPKLKILIKKCSDKYYHEKQSIPGVLLHTIQKHDTMECLLPYGVWLGYSVNGNLEFEVDFNILKPKSFLSKERNKTIDFDYSACEIRKYDDKKRLISREYKSLKEIKPNPMYDDLGISDVTDTSFDNLTSYQLLESIIDFDNFILPFFQKITSEDLRSNFELITNKRNWIQGFKLLYNMPKEGELPPYVPFYHESGEELVNLSDKVNSYTYNKSHLEISTFCEQDALKIINEIMIFNGGVKSFKEIGTQQPYDVEFRNQIIRISKGVPQIIDFPISEGRTIDADTVFICVDLLPPKNVPNSFIDTNKMRGIHPDSKYINNLLVGLNTPVFCFLEGGVSDGRLSVIRDDTSRIIISMNTDFDSTNFRNIIKCFSDSNPILDMDNEKMKKLLDDSDAAGDIKLDTSVFVYDPNLTFKKEDSVFSFKIGDKLLISFLKKFGFYQMRIDKVVEQEWEALLIDKDEKLEFYISKTNESSMSNNKSQTSTKL